MKKIIILAIAVVVMFSGCSALPKKSKGMSQYEAYIENQVKHANSKSEISAYINKLELYEEWESKAIVDAPYTGAMVIGQEEKKPPTAASYFASAVLITGMIVGGIHGYNEANNYKPDSIEEYALEMFGAAVVRYPVSVLFWGLVGAIPGAVIGTTILTLEI